MIYNKMFNKEFSRKDIWKLKENCKDFEELHKKYIHKILNMIEKCHRKKWNYQFIPIYIVDRVPNCFSDPLTIKYFKNPKMMLVLLAHELLHNNFVGKWDFKDSEELHKYMEPILNKVIRDLGINLKEELKIFNEKTMALTKKAK